jgi:hypothetical protein
MAIRRKRKQIFPNPAQNQSQGCEYEIEQKAGYNRIDQPAQQKAAPGPKLI